MVKKLETLSAEVKTHHCTILDHKEDQNKLTEEQAVLDDNEDKVQDLMEHLEDLVEPTGPEMPHTSGMVHYRLVVRSITEAEHISQRLSQVLNSLMKTKSCGRQGITNVVVRRA